MLNWDEPGLPALPGPSPTPATPGAQLGLEE